MTDKSMEAIFLSSDNLTLIFAQTADKQKPRSVSVPLQYSLNERGIQRDVTGVCKLDDRVILPIEMAQDALRIFIKSPFRAIEQCHVLLGRRDMKNFTPGPAVREIIQVHVTADFIPNQEKSLYCICVIGRTHRGFLERDYDPDAIWEPEEVLIQLKKRPVVYRYQKYRIDGQDVFRIKHS